jgi:SAM-dependent methyltransferase
MENLKTETPELWMDGWSNLYKKQSELTDEELKKLDPSYPVQLFLSLAETKGLNVLEFASGNGDNAFSLYEAGCNVTGFDASASSMELLKYRAGLLGVDPVRFKMSLADMLTFPFEKDEYDVILANQCLQYLFDNTISKFREIADKIKPGGWFIYSGNILPHKATEKPIRFITPEEIKENLKGWVFHSFGTDEILLRKDDLRGYVHFVARKPETR